MVVFIDILLVIFSIGTIMESLLPSQVQDLEEDMWTEEQSHHAETQGFDEE